MKTNDVTLVEDKDGDELTACGGEEGISFRFSPDRSGLDKIKLTGKEPGESCNRWPSTAGCLLERL